MFYPFEFFLFSKLPVHNLGNFVKEFGSETEGRKDGKELFYLRWERLEHVKMKMEGRKAKDSSSSWDWKDGQRAG